MRPACDKLLSGENGYLHGSDRQRCLLCRKCKVTFEDVCVGPSCLAEEKPCMPAAALCYNFPHISPPEYPSISYPHPSLSFWMKRGACVAVEMLLPNKERNSVVLAGET